MCLVSFVLSSEDVATSIDACNISDRSKLCQVKFDVECVTVQE
jgi:hypothetical protein